HFFTHIPQPMHKNSEMYAILSVGLTSIHNFPRTLYQRILRSAQHARGDLRRRTFLHSCAHRFGLHLLESTIAIRVILSDMATMWGGVEEVCAVRRLL
ncbi:hypothetical protein BD311DRAFT_650749, partial [Dichomitus squalens]